MDITINKKHAHYARRENLTSCPAARAFRCAGFKGVEVDGDYVEFITKTENDGDDTVSYALPKTLRDAIRDFDSGKPFRLGTYRIAGLRKPVK